MTPAEAALLVSVGRLMPDGMPAVATAFLVDGWDTDDVAAAAMPDTRDPRDVRDLFLKALESLQVPIPPWETAVRAWLINLAGRRARSELTPRQAAEEFHETVTYADIDRLDDPCFFELAGVADLDDDDLPGWLDVFDEALLQCADRLPTGTGTAPDCQRRANGTAGTTPDQLKHDGPAYGP